MCGLVGAFRADKGIFTKAAPFITQGLFISVLRGYSGCGVGLINHQYKPDFVKSRLASPDFIQTKNFSWVENNAPGSRVIMGHTRAPTGGVTSYENSHPFWYVKESDPLDSIILTHNGHINNYHALTPNNFNHQVDSAHVTHSILIEGAVPTLQKLEGYYVLTWYSEKDKNFHIARNNSNRDLFLASSPGKDIIYYASEKEILQFCLDRLDIPYIDKGKEEAFWQLEPFKMYSWDLTKPTLEDPVVQEYEEKKRPTYTTNFYGGGNRGMPEAGDRIYVDCESNDIQFYSNSETHGFVMAKRKLDNGEVRIDGVAKEDWDLMYKHIKNILPCIVDTSRSETVSGHTNYFYKCRIHAKEAGEDFARRCLPNPEKDKKKETEPNKVGLTSILESGTKSSEELSQPLLPGPNDTMIPLREWREIAKLGCVGCNGVILTLDKEKILWFPWRRCPEDPPEDTEWQMICPLCAKDPSKLTQIYGA